MKHRLPSVKLIGLCAAAMTATLAWASSTTSSTVPTGATSLRHAPLHVIHRLAAAPALAATSGAAQPTQQQPSGNAAQPQQRPSGNAAQPQQRPAQRPAPDPQAPPNQAPAPGSQQPSAPSPGARQQPAQPRPDAAPAPAPTPGQRSNVFERWPRSSKLRIHVIDGRTLKPLEGAEVVVIESEQRLRTDRNGYTPWFDAPLIRDPRYRPMIQELHGQLGVIAYKNGYRDSVHLGIRLNPNTPTETTVWMYKLGPGDVRVEPVLYQEPYHHLWLIRLADRYRSSSQLGEGFQHP